MFKKQFMALTLSASLVLSFSSFTKALKVNAENSINYNPKLSSSTITIPPIKNLSSDFIKGMDVSMLKQIEDNGGKYYDGLFDANGNPKSEDCLVILKKHGVNWIRLRIWNNPTQGGGNNDLTTTLNLASRAKALGLKVLLDFHYSDFWADPNSQTIPAAWSNDTKEKTGNYATLENDVYTFTKDTLNTLKAHNALPDMVQIGNEINDGMLWNDGKITGENSGGYDELARLINSGSKAVREVQGSGNKIKIVLHLAKGGDNTGFTTFFDAMNARNVDYDVIGLSFYPYWHGPVSSLKDNLNKLSARYPAKEFVIAETAYAYTLEEGDSSANNFGAAQETAGVFPATVQGQATEVRAMMDIMAQLPNNRGLGIFYWEGDWTPVKGADWKTGGGNAWENQAMFDFNGNALPSLDVFNAVSSNTSVEPNVISIPQVNVDGFVGIDPTSSLPTTVDVVYSDGNIKAQSVTWDKVSAEDYSKAGKITINGSVAGTDIKAAAVVNVSTNLLKNGGFETGDTSGWDITGDDANDGVIKMDSWTADGGKYTLNSWKATNFNYKISQTLTNIPNGIYTLKAWVVGTGDGKSTVQLFASDFGGPDMTLDVSKNSSWTQVTLGNIKVTDGKCTVGMNVDALGGSWWDLDGVEFSKDEDTAPASSSVLENGGFETGDTSSWDITGDDANDGVIKMDSWTADGGKYTLNSWKATEFNYKVSQSVSNIPNGIYTLKAWVVGTGDGKSTVNLFASDFGGTAMTFDASKYGKWTQISLENIKVTNGKCTVGMDVNAQANSWWDLDGVELSKVSDLPAPAPTNETLKNVSADIIQALWSSDNVTVDATDNTLVDKSIFAAIKGANKNVTFIQKAADGSLLLSWTFNGADINQAIKDVDLKAALSSNYKEAMTKLANGYDVLPISFSYEGILPGKALIKIKLSNSWLQGKDKNNIYLYHYDPTANSYDLVAQNLKADKNGYVEFSIYHCSDYFVMDKDIKTVTATKGSTTSSSGSDISKTSSSNTASTTASKLPKTGGLIDDKVLAGLGIFFLAIGVFVVTYKKKRNY
ncbi:glycosyl hydrolase 53 family protein [Clostridium sp. 19966]|uniref:glycosyl hydrolase 53 family protein n=1 Tax=Clostridium sp. 19966 TaxID=2768166 RepID=UPI0028DE9B28|nr:glycosyl hydrolase 53 family protein [Clostridium sp. 19966]MDT8718818.1 glycosyl hydrolase 53 family protein [Clostridium sp. 19966]